MKILNLDLTAFGPFTDNTLEFGDEQRRLHIIYGPNEAGKSSALRALNALLFGMGGTTDNFIHDDKNLLLEGKLAFDDGSVLGFIRKKSGLKRSDGPAMTQKNLIALLKGLDKDTFINEFGIDHEVLVRGGKDLLTGKGEVGRSLFSAALGKTGLPEVLKKLEADANSLFRKGASKGPEILKLKKEYDDLKKAAVRVMLSPAEWSKKRDELDDLIKASEQIAEEIKNTEAERNRLTRISSYLPKIHKRAELLSQRDALGKVVLLPTDFTESRRTTVQQLAAGRIALDAAAAERTRLEAEAAGLDIPQPLLDNEETIRQLVESCGSYKKAIKDAVKLQGQLKAHQDDIDSMLKELGKGVTLDAALNMRPAASSRARIQDLSNKHQGLIFKVESAKKDLDTARDDLSDAMTRLEEMGHAKDPGELKNLAASIQKSGDIEASLDELVLEREKAREKLNTDLTKMPMWIGSTDAIEKVAIPLPENVDEYDERFTRLESDRAFLLERLVETEQEIGELEVKLKELQKIGDVPDEKELAEARARREKGWSLVRRAWLENEDVTSEAVDFEPDVELPEAYEKNVEKADSIADRLRREADRVAANAELVISLEDHKNKKSEIAEKIAELDDSAKALAAEWKEMWPAEITDVGTPRVMRPWLSLRDEVVTQAAAVHDLDRRGEQADVKIETNRRSLLSAIKPLVRNQPADDSSLGILIETASEVIASTEEENRARKGLAESIPVLELEVQGLESGQAQAINALSDWQNQWSTAIGVIGLQEDASPVEAMAVLDLLAGLFAKVDAKRELQSRLDGIAADSEEFEKDTQYLLGVTIPELVSLAPDQAVSQVNIALGKAKENTVKLAGLQKQIEQKMEEMKTTENLVSLAEAELTRLCQQAECNTPNELEKAEGASKAYKDMEKSISEIELNLAEESAGATIEEMIKASKDQDADMLAASISSIETKLRELKDKQIGIAEDKGKSETLFKQMDGSDQAAELEEAAQEKLALLWDKVEQYIRVRMAYLFLRDEIDRYRTENEEPLLKRAGELFSKLTLKSFSRLTTDYNEKDEPVLVGVRPDAETVKVEGMSDGTVDQMYLALRLATLERRLAVGEMVPVVFDDVLIRFDDDRSQAALHVLEELSEKTQVIYFTHDKRIVESAKRLFKNGTVQIHELQMDV